MTLAANLERSAFFFPDRPVLSENISEITYAQLNDQANRIATALIRLRVKPGDTVGLFAPNASDWITVYFGALKVGAVAVTLSSQLTRDEMHLLLNHSKPKVLFTCDEKLDDLAGLQESDWLEAFLPELTRIIKNFTQLRPGEFKDWQKRKA